METKDTGIGLSALVFLVFLVLKLTNVIGWSWWWVTAPLWVPIAIGLLILVGVLLYHSIRRR